MKASRVLEWEREQISTYLLTYTAYDKKTFGHMGQMDQKQSLNSLNVILTCANFCTELQGTGPGNPGYSEWTSPLLPPVTQATQWVPVQWSIDRGSILGQPRSRNGLCPPDRLPKSKADDILLVHSGLICTLYYY